MTDQILQVIGMAAVYRHISKLACLSAWSGLLAASDNLSYTFGAHYDSVCLATASAAALYRTDSNLDYFVQMSPGIHGGKVSIGCGYALSAGIEGPGPSIWVDTVILAGKLSYLYAWNPPERTEFERNFLGLEIEGGVLLSSSIGVFRAVDPSRSGSSWRVIWTLGIGL